MADDLRANLDQFLPQARSDHGSAALSIASIHEVAQVVGERVQLEANGIGGESLA
jgi:hypothetical protein